MRKKAKKAALSVITVLLVSGFPAVFMYCQNADAAGFSEVISVLGLYIICGMALLEMGLLLMRSFAKATLAASLFMLIIPNFSFFEMGMKWILPELKYWHIVSVLLVIAFHISWLVWRYVSEELASDIEKILCMVFSVLILFNGVSNIHDIVCFYKIQKELAGSILHDHEQASSDGLPNVYLFIWDEYANFPQMKKYYNYDNAPLLNFLKEKNFSISYSSHNESIWSRTIQTNMMNLDYVVDNYTNESECRLLRVNGALFDLMREHGYEVKKFELDDSFYGGIFPGNDNNRNVASATTVNGEDLQKLLLKQSIFYPFLKSNLGTTGVGWELPIRAQEMTDYFSSPENLPDGSTFSLIYYLFPHQPFRVNENGAPVSAYHEMDWDDPQYYLGQFKYSTKLMLRVLDNLMMNDPNAIILLMSDHGARGSLGSMFTGQFAMEDMTCPLNAVYYQGREMLEIEGLSSVNTLRLVMNKMFDLHYEMLPVPEDTYPYKFRESE